MLTDSASVAADSRAVTRALGDAVTAAGYAPSLHGARPWQWRLGGEVLDLYVDRDHVRADDGVEGWPSIMGCGAVLHHTLVNLATNGWQATALRLPDATFPGHLASIRVDHSRAAGTTTPDHPVRAANGPAGRVPGSGGVGYADTLRSVAMAAESVGTSLCLLRAEQLFDLVTATIRPPHAPPGMRQAASPTTPAPTTPAHPGGAGSGVDGFEPDDQAAVFAILYGPEDRPRDWLCAGEALAAAWLTADSVEMSVLPLSDTINPSGARENVRRLLPEPGHPYLVLRLGPPRGRAAR